MSSAQEFGDELAFVHVQAGARFVGESPRADFGRAGMIEDVGLPGILDAVTHGGYRSARLAGQHQQAHAKRPTSICRSSATSAMCSA